MKFYAYKKDTDTSIPGFIYRELQLHQFHSKVDRDNFVELHGGQKVKARAVSARHMRTFLHHAGTRPDGGFSAVVDSGINETAA